MREELLGRIKEELTEGRAACSTSSPARAVDIQAELARRAHGRSSTPESFEGVLRPAFQQDEWKLILAGAALGLGAGVLQLVYLFGDMMDDLGI